MRTISLIPLYEFSGINTPKKTVEKFLSPVSDAYFRIEWISILKKSLLP